MVSGCVSLLCCLVVGGGCSLQSLLPRLMRHLDMRLAEEQHELFSTEFWGHFTLQGYSEKIFARFFAQIFR